MEFFKTFIPSIHKDGYYFVLIFLVVTVILGMISNSLGWVGVILTVWCMYFFRDPDRIIPNGDHLIVSPADGVVVNIEKIVPPSSLNLGDHELERISIFLNIFDVHVNRVPANGTIKLLHYHPGKFINASMDKASEHNERQEIMMEMSDGSKIAFVQIAGLIARRIVCDLDEGQNVESGSRFGIIRFGSRVDIYLPEGVSPVVAVGQRAISGETIIADLNHKEGRSGIKR